MCRTVREGVIDMDHGSREAKCAAIIESRRRIIDAQKRRVTLDGMDRLVLKPSLNAAHRRFHFPVKSARRS